LSLLGLDVGTTGCKAVVFDENGNELARAYREYRLLHPKPGWSELSTTVIWSSVKDVLKQVAGNAAGDPPEALSVSCQGEAVTPIDRDGNSLYNFSVSFDDRTIPQYEWWLKHSDRESIFRITGMPLHPMHTINKIMWFKKNRKDIYDKTFIFLCVEDYLLFKLSGELATDYSLAARTMAFDVRAKHWSNEILDKAGVERALLPPPQPSGTAVGNIRASIAEKLSLPKNLAVVTGGHDQPCGALGAGIIREGLALNATGTSDVICPIMQEPVLTKKMLDGNYSCYPYTLDDYYCSIGFNLTGGLLLRWYRDILCTAECVEAEQSDRNPYEIIIERASPEIARPMFLPHFVGSGTPMLDPVSRGALVNMTIDVDKSELNRAVLDSLNYEMRYNIESMENAGIRIERIRATGGGAKSEKWLQLKADVFGKTVELLDTSEAASLGAALLAGKAVGKYKDLTSDINEIVRINRVFEPDISRHHQYADMYHSYKEIYPAIRELNHNLARRQKRNEPTR
jgi:xylulokinase